MSDERAVTAEAESVPGAVVRFAGDSGDGMQTIGSQFTETAALAGNDLATFPDFPAEIRAPAGTQAGVSGFQVHFSSQQVFTPGDAVDALVAMNPAALAKNLHDVKRGGLLLLDESGFTAKNVSRAKLPADPREDGSLDGFRVVEVDITGLTLKAIQELRLPNRTATRCKNMFALGLVYWMYSRSLDHTRAFIAQRFQTKPDIAKANQLALDAGYHYGETHELFAHVYQVDPAALEPGLYRNVSGNEALAYGLMAAAELSQRELFYGSYPITPASPILHYLSKQKALGVTTFQAEDEIAAVCSAIGASYSGALGVTASSGPGIALKQEAIALCCALELPLVVVNVQRAGPSTGMPTKTEQADLLQAIFGRHGESPLPIVAARSPGDCFYAAIEASRIALRYTTPVMLLSDGYIANGAEPWKVPDLSTFSKLTAPVLREPTETPYVPYARNEDLARPLVEPGVKGMEHRIGGLEKEHLSGNISYNPQNHEKMSRLRLEKVEKVADSIPPSELFGEPTGDVVLVSWGGTYGALRDAVTRLRAAGHAVAHLHLRHLNPFPHQLKDRLLGFRSVLVPELNLGQLLPLLRAHALIDARPVTKIQGQPFKVAEIMSVVLEELERLVKAHKTKPGGLS